MGNYKTYLDMAAEYARDHSTCLKVSVGAAFVTDDGRMYLSANNGREINCKEIGECYKAKVTGVYESVEWTRKYCASVHAEICMIETLLVNNVDPSCGTLYVTRYPCENCARKTAEFGIRRVVYGGVQEISDVVKKIYSDHGVEVIWHPECDYEF